MNKSGKQLGVGDVAISQLAKKYVNDVLDTSRISYGRYTKEFESKFAKIHSVQHAVFCNSGTSALLVAVRLLKEKYNWDSQDEIIVPALGFVATVNVVIQNNLKPVFVDVDPVFFEIDPARISEKITKKTRAIMAVHIAGLPAEMTAILKIARDHKLVVIEDSCETVFARYGGKSVGTFGEISCFSTYAAHILVTGVGGLICTNDKDLAIKARSLINHGRDISYVSIDDDKQTNRKLLERVVRRRFVFNNIGYSFRVTEFEAALGFAQLSEYKKHLKKRIANAAYLIKGLTSLSNYLQLPSQRYGADHVFMIFPIVVKRKDVDVEKLLFFLEENNIETRYLFPLINQPIYKKFFKFPKKDFPVASYLSKNGFYIGCHNGFAKADLDYIISKFHQYFKLNNRDS